MRRIATSLAARVVLGAGFVLGAGCTTTPAPVTGIFSVTTRNFGGDLCTSPGTPTPPAVPDFELVADAADEVAYEWCDSPTRCNPIGSFDWFAPDGDHWTRVTASVHAGPDNSIVCSLGFDTLAIRETGDNVHVDLLLKGGSGDPAQCTPERAIALLEHDEYCSIIDRYDLARLP